MLTESAWLQTEDWKDATFETVTLGETFGPLELVVSDHFIKRFAFMIDDYGPWYLGETSPFGRRIGHAAILAPELLRLTNLTYNPNTEAAVHQKEEIWLLSPVFVNERVILSGRFVDKYVKRGKGYVVMEAEARSAEDEPPSREAQVRGGGPRRRRDRTRVQLSTQGGPLGERGVPCRPPVGHSGEP